ncbi:alpha/beta fold hydrolase [Algoriphagus lacus]|uniref:Alpha/beta fold hydrolase n=1 Tax=Algoriphagus lacus TaxID=2056311 RepID=A0A418PNB5_9BACT|nr:alpha/beta fold hydrolase [Algoriphagus lacus]RIW13382.1 alpha/beta fold hydrolase [Algoriphagus lacus]
MELIKLKTRKEYWISASVFPQDSFLVLIISPATGVKQSFYHPFANYLNENGITVITFDFHGIGESLADSIKTVSTSASEWGVHDLESVIEFSKVRFSLSKIFVLGHSIGGQLLGFAKSSVDLEKIILIGSQSGYWGFWKGSEKLKMWATWHVLFPALLKIYRYFPAKSFSRMEDLPKEVGLQWSKWCRSPDYFLEEFNEDVLYFKSIVTRVTCISIEDDKFAPIDAVNWLADRFSKAQIKRVHLDPYDFGYKSIGHFGIFKENNRLVLWRMLLREILE